MSEQALRFNEGKPELSYLLSFGVGLEDLAAVMSQGAIKYERDNWLKGGKPVEEYLDSAMRHLVAFRTGAVYDPETGCKHLAHVAWNMLAALRLTSDLAGVPSIDPTFDQEAFRGRHDW